MILHGTKPAIEISNNLIIVGSSKNMLDKKLGYRIDEFKEVVRFNRAPTKDYEEYVGSKTTIRITNPGVFQCVQHKVEVFDSDWSGEGQPQYFIRELENEKILVIYRCINEMNAHAHHAELLHESCSAHRFSDIPPKKQSVGFVLIEKCLQSRITPYIYGFGLNEGCEASHYWENKPPQDVTHDYGTERQRINTYIREGRIKVLK